ncbi:MAG: 23S rRNA (guanosine-2'-O-) -methyltransferase rlmB [Candidatus Carbobacillus altaicus]|uniref:23S rRNA (Guanosine-2'-O-)-methyltransferase rlmB n=1 Tax=Candidatus Carbonibacillus altaicus TaxID=2163959 RepID=A0A2R6Y4K1_9BACL|nr:MAG: 23S rRNA (guanosine-2'-O-) -methyltransferase rlmB [Candidatus Carbobacillus altaicus]
MKEARKRYRVIQSAQNPRFKHWLKLKTVQGRKREGQVLLEGWTLVGDALKAGVLQEVIADDEEKLKTLLSSGKGTAFNTSPLAFLISPDLARRLSETESPQGLFGMMAMPDVHRSAADVTSRDLGCFILALDALQDPGNVGTLLRSAVAFGVRTVVLGKGTVDPWSGKVLRSGMGAHFHLRLYQVELEEALPRLRADGYAVYAASPHRGEELEVVEKSARRVLLLGSEAHGLRKELFHLADRWVRIPMSGEMESLNVAVAGSILLYGMRML